MCQPFCKPHLVLNSALILSKLHICRIFVLSGHTIIFANIHATYSSTAMDTHVHAHLKTCTDFKECRNYSLHTNWGLAHSAWLSIWNKYTCKYKTGKMQNQWNTCFPRSPKPLLSFPFSYLRWVTFSGVNWWHMYLKMESSHIFPI